MLLVEQRLFWNGFDAARGMRDFIVLGQRVRIIYRLAKQRGFICRQRRLGWHIGAFAFVHFLPTEVLLTSMNDPYTVNSKREFYPSCPNIVLRREPPYSRCPR